MSEVGQEAIPSLADWMYAWEAAVEAGQSSITREEAERRYFKRYRVNDVDEH